MMASLKKIDDQTWLLILTSPSNPLGYNALFCVTAYPCGDTDEECEVLIFDLFAAPEGVESRILEIRTEIYHTRAWVVDTPAFVESLVERYHACLNHAYPAELVYEFGGTVQGKTPPMFVSPELVH